MIRKFLLIGDSGLLQHYINQDNVNIDADLLSGFSKALFEVSRELTYVLETVGFRSNKMVVENIQHNGSKSFLISAIFDDYHIEEGIKNKVHHIYNKFLKSIDFENETRHKVSEEINDKIILTLNDIYLKSFIDINVVIFTSILDPVIFDKENEISAYCLCSASNEILLYNATKNLMKNKPSQSIEKVLQEYLLQVKLDEIPHGDKFIGLDLPFGLDIKDYNLTGKKTIGVVINTSINLKDEPKNELLLYFFGKNTLIRSCVVDVEYQLREMLT